VDEETMSRVMREMGRKGGLRRKETTTPKQRRAWAKKAAAVSAKVRSKKAKARARLTKPRGD
jgi:hypothetical protein